MTRRSFTLVMAFAFVLLGLAGCADAPNSVGSHLLPPGDRPVLQQDTLYAASHFTRRQIVRTDAGSMILIGDTANYSSWAMLQFTALPDSLYFAKLTNAHITLTCRYRFGSPTAPLSFDVYRAARGWDGDSLTVDSLLLFPNNYYDPTPLASVNAGVIADTGTVDIPIADTALVRSWFNAIPDTTQPTYGLVIRPRNTSVIRGFGSFSNTTVALRPTLSVDYAYAASFGSYTAQYGFSRFLATVPTADVLKDTSSYAYIENGISFRSTLTFDITRLPRSTVVNRAYLEVSLAPSQSLRTGFVPDSLFAAYISSTGALGLFRGSLVYSDSVHRQFYQFEVKEFLQNWLASPVTPRRVMLSGYSEAASLDLIAIYGATAPLALRPRLRIVYSSLQH